MIDYIVAMAVVVVPVVLLATTSLAVAGYTLVQLVKKKDK